ncbi:Bax inhibitor-1/YccA family protein [Schumannella sp. 10F1B-5-1]|uniref:Bax inhibitor-1/YccA family protein n=1 Tax=Schumannella sp. 10F1B-5-1 TaxID=2590780 RepID=UPI00113280E8|nr:Bax inhibitor-1/YccA family protein [Schumannella sp. 10F1B-5-1]TPW71792.1 Bax inhibitor-1/YccA family protein [Schumannella sp. 10F1B-5-1]
MANGNPAFRSPAFSERGTAAPPIPTPEQLAHQYDLPSATPVETDRMTYEDTAVKTVVSFAVLLVGAVVGYVVADFAPIIVIPAAIAGLVLALVNIFKKRPSAPLVLAYSAVQGIVVGAISNAYAGWYDGIIPVAVFGTLAVVGVTLALFASGKIRASARATKIFLVAMIGYMAFSLVNVVLMLTGVTSAYGGLRGVEIAGIPLGIPLGILVVIMAAYSLVLDFDSIQQGVRNGAPRVYAWAGAFGIVVTVVWLYLEILRLVSYFMPRN